MDKSTTYKSPATSGQPATANAPARGVSTAPKLNVRMLAVLGLVAGFSSGLVMNLKPDAAPRTVAMASQAMPAMTPLYVEQADDSRAADSGMIAQD